MSIEYSKRIDVDGTAYAVQKFTARKSLALLTRLLKLVGEPMSAFTSGVDKDMAEILPKAVKALADRLDDQEIISLIEDILKGVTLGGGSQSPDLDTHFQGRIGHLFKVVFEALKFQYNDFFDVLAVLKPEGMARGIVPK